MKKLTPTQIGIGIASLIVVSVGSFFGITALRAVKDDVPGSNSGSDPGSGTGNTSTPGTGEILVGEKIESSKFPLKLGSAGKYVIYVQAAINFKYGNIITVDGKFGQEVRDALYKYYNYYSALLPFVTLDMDISDFNKIVPMKNQQFLNYVKQYKSIFDKYK